MKNNSDVRDLIKLNLSLERENNELKAAIDILKKRYAFSVAARDRKIGLLEKENSGLRRSLHSLNELMKDVSRR